MAIKLINKIPEPTEHEMQCTLFAILKVYEERIPEWQAIYAIPNGAKLPYKNSTKGRRYSNEAIWLLKEGMKPGTPDICCPFGQYGHLYIEMKRSGNKTSPGQDNRMKLLRSVGNFVKICRSTGEAMEAILIHTLCIYRHREENSPDVITSKRLNLLTEISNHKY